MIKIRKFISVLLLLALILCLFSACGENEKSAVTEPTLEPFTPIDDNPLKFVYTVNEDGRTCTITKYSPNAPADLVIPSTIDGYKVTAIGDYAFCYVSLNYFEPNLPSNFTSVVIPEGVTSIGEHAFQFCDKLKSVKIPSSVNKIGESAFSACEALEAIEIPNGVEEIGDYAFSGSDAIKSIFIPASVKYIGQQAFLRCTGLEWYAVDTNNQHYTVVDDILYTKDMTTLIHCPVQKTEVMKYPNGLRVVGDYAFTLCKEMTSVRLPDGVQTVGEGAFALCTKLKNVYLPDSVQSVGGGAFDCSSNIQEVRFGEGITKIGDKAFRQCNSITALYIPGTIETIGDHAFVPMNELKDVQFSGTKDQWESVVNGRIIFYPERGYILDVVVSCTDGDIHYTNGDVVS